MSPRPSRRAADRQGDRAQALPPPGDPAPRRIGLLGGSFNPAHAGHLHVSRLALDRLRLDEVWWLVSPQNPLKPARGMAPFAARVAGARAVTRHERIRVTDLEATLGTRYSVDTMAAIRARWPAFRFVWLAGADILIQLPHWRRWARLMRLMPVAVFARGPLVFRALSGRAATRFACCRRPERDAPVLARLRPPAWIFLHTPRHPASATRIRRQTGPGGA